MANAIQIKFMDYLTNKTTYIIASLLFLFVFAITTTSIVNDSLTMDELAHLPAGYSYLTQRDMRLNPEHPPLIKDLSALPLLFIKNIQFPSDIKAWKEDVNGQWIFGNYLMYKAGNPAEEMIFWGRIPMILLLLLLGFYIFRWARELFGNEAGLLALFLFSLSPTFLAHGRLVTTDVGAAAGALISTYYFIKFLKESSKKNLVKAGIALGLAELAKYSLILLIPFFGIIAIIWPIVKNDDNSKRFKAVLKDIYRYVGYCFLIGLIAFALIWIFYQYHTWSYPPERQVSDTKFTLQSFNIRILVDSVVYMADKPILRPIAQYLLGLFMVLQRAAGGNTGYFMGEVSAAGWKSYFPVVYLIKETLVFHLITILAILSAIYFAIKRVRPSFKSFRYRLFHWTKNHYAELSGLLFIAIYWFTSLRSNLNIGVRHLLPVFPFTIIISCGLVALFYKNNPTKLKKAALAALMLFQIYSVLSVYPYFLTYFNEAVGGPSQGYKYAVDSNLDWGQDLKRLNQWAEENNVSKIYLNYFGGSDTDYYLKGKYIYWDGLNKPEDLPKGNYLAVSATLLQGGKGKPVPGFTSPTGYFSWLDKYQPVAIIGNSIFVFRPN